MFAAIRLLVALSPPLRETYYDEALTGLMSLAILRGVPQVFYWGQPYLGALDAYLAAGAFYRLRPLDPRAPSGGHLDLAPLGLGGLAHRTEARR